MPRLSKKDYSVHMRVSSDIWFKFQAICDAKGLKASSTLNLFIVHTNKVSGNNLANLLEEPHATN